MKPAAPQYDLHTHSLRSDGTLAPATLVRDAAAAGVTVLALTDHDVTDGLTEAAQAAAEAGIRLVPGVEISVTWGSLTVHVVGLHIDPAHAALQEGLARLRAFRVWRAEEIARRLEKAGVHDPQAGACRYATGALVSRTHFARYLVEIGRADSVREVFEKYLVRGKPGYVPGQWAALDEVVGWICAAGGQAVLAHPARYKLSATRLRQLIEEFKAAGGEAIEVVSGSHSRDDALRFAGLSRHYELLASAGSDYHGPEQAWLRLGAMPALPEQCRPIWQSWPG
jgi:hypothetical protein